MKNSKKEIILTTVLCVLPILAGLAVYKQLPNTIATHFGFNGEANGYSSKAFTVFGMPLMLAGFNLLLHFALNTDPKRQNISTSMRRIAIWTLPILSIFMYVVTIGKALGYDLHIETITPLLVGLLFIIIGNYLPKT